MEKLDNRELRVWLRDMARVTGSFYCDNESAHIVTVLLHYGWIEFDNAIKPGKEDSERQMLIRYRLTDFGRIELGIPDAGKRALGTDTQADSVAATPRIQPFTQPVDDSEATGKRYHYHLDCGNDKCLVRRGELPDSRSEVVAAFNDDDTGDIHAETCLEAIEAETRALREQNARLQAELDKARQRVSELEGQNKAMHNVIQHVAKTASDAIPKGVKEFTQAEKALRYIVSSIQNGVNGVAVTIILL